MSAAAEAWAWSLQLRPAEAKLVMLAIADNTDPNGWTQINFRRLAAKCCMSTRRVERIVMKLTDMDLISRDPIWKLPDGKTISGVGPHFSDPRQASLELVS